MRHSKLFSLKTSLASVLFLVAGGSVAQAQLDEIIVTAERKSANLQDVPIAVTALGGEAIERAGIHDPATLQFKVPNFSFSAFSPGQNIFSLRGISSNDDGAGTENSVAVFFDDVYFGRISNSAFDFFDVERVEVLRGPQGTLWGKNAIGGAINVTSKKPSLDGWHAKAKVSVGNYNARDFGGYLTGPIAENLAVKVSYNSRDRDGFVKNVLDGVTRSDSNGLLNDNSTSVRAQVLWEATDDTSVLFTASQQATDESDIARIPINNQNPAHTGATQGPATLAAFRAAGGSAEDLRSVNPSSGFSRSDSETYSVKVIHQLGEGELTYIGAYYETVADWEMDSVGAPTLALIDDIYDTTEATTHEVRYAVDLSDTLSLLVGAFYLEEDTDRTEWFRIIRGGDDRVPIAGVATTDDFNDGYRQINNTESKALFANVDWQFSPDWALAAGVRWTEDEKSIVSFAQSGLPNFIINGDIGNVDNATGGLSASDSWSDISPKIALNWTPNQDTLLYLSWAQGFKSGGFGAAPANANDIANLALEPEEAINIELGVKADLVDNTLRVNAAVFQTDYENLQYQRFGPLLAAVSGGTALPGVADVGIDPNSFGQFRTINAGKGTIEGFEVEVIWVPTTALTLNGSYGYLKTEQEIDFSAYFSTAPSSPVILTRPQNRAPENQYSLGVLYEQPLSNAGMLVYSVDYSYSDESRADVVNEFAVEDERSLFDASVTYVNEDAGWQFSVWGKNLADDRYFAHVYAIGRGVIGKIGDPRTFGASLTLKY